MPKRESVSPISWASNPIMKKAEPIHCRAEGFRKFMAHI